MNEFRDLGDLGICGEAFPEEIFDRLDVVIGGGFDGLDALAISFRKIFDQCIELGDCRRGKRRHFLQCRFRGQRLQPFDLDADPLFDQRAFAEAVAQRTEFAVVAAVERGEGGQWCQCHGFWHGFLLGFLTFPKT